MTPESVPELIFITLSLFIIPVFILVFGFIVIMQDHHLLFALDVSTSLHMTFTAEVTLSFAHFLSVPSDKYDLAI